MPVSFNVPVHVNDEYAEGPSHARITLDDKQITRLFQLQKVVKEYKLYCVEEWDTTPELFTGPEDDGYLRATEWTGAWDCMTLKVEDECFLWNWYLKGTSTSCDTESISFEELKEQIMENDRVMRAPKSELPRLAMLEAPAKGALKYESSRELVEKRLKGERK